MSAPPHVLAIIPARASSKGLPGKNLMLLDGKTLIEWALEAALVATSITDVVVTSDSPEVLAIARRHDCATIARRPELATDDAAMIDVVLDAIALSPPADIAVLLQPTSPLRNAADIDAVVRVVAQDECQACVSVSEIEHHPQWMFFREGDGRLHPVMGSWELGARRQDLRRGYMLNGAVYAARTEWLQEHRAFLTPETFAYPMPAHRSIDVDTATDFARAERSLKSSSN